MKITVPFSLFLLLVSSVWLTKPPLNIDLNQPAQELEEHVHHDPEQHQPQQAQHDTNTCTKYHEPGCGHWGKLTPYQRTRNTQKKYYWNMPDEKKLARSRRGKEILTKEQKEQYRLTALMKEKKNPTKKQNREQGKGYWKDLRERKRKGDQVRGYEKISDYWQKTTRTKKRKREDDNNDHHNPSPQ